MHGTTDSNAISTRGLTKIYPGGVEAVSAVDLDIAPGEVFGLLGPNGAGKSTTVGMLTTTITPTAGVARVGGFDVATHPREARSVSAVVFQEPTVDRSLTGGRNLEVHARLWGLGRDATATRITDVTTAFGLADLVDRPVGTYSGGERRRLEIARALLSDPQILFLDEPTVGLDPRIRFELLDHIAGLRAGRMTILLTTHYLDEAEQLCDRVAIVSAGRIVALDTPAALLASLGREIVEVRVDRDAPAALATLRRRHLTNGDAFVVGNTIHVPVHDGSARDLIAAIGDADLPTKAIATRTPTLDDVFLHLTGNPLEVS
jgi:ABC-2 type transport system ATP-binding protein